MSALPRYQVEPSVAALGDVVVATWQSHAMLGWGFSLDGGLTWTDGGEFPSPYPLVGQNSVCVDATGNFYAVCRANGAVAFYRGRWDGVAFTWNEPDFPLIYFAVDRPWVTCDPERGYVYLSYARFGGSLHQIEIIRSLDGGATWSAPLVLSGTRCNGARPAVGPDGELYVVWEDFEAAQMVGRKSVDFGASFGPPFVVGAVLDNLGMAPPGYVSRDHLLPPGLFVGPDFPSVAVDRSSGLGRGTACVAWADYATGTVSPQTGGKGESEPNDFLVNATPVSMGDDISGLAVSIDFDPDGDIDWFSFEAMAGTTLWLQGELIGSVPYVSQPLDPGTCYLRCGADTSSFLFLTSTFVVDTRYYPPSDPMIFTVPQTGRYYLGVTGPAFPSVQYRLRLRQLEPAPGQAAQDHRDIVLVSSSDGGASWSQKVRVNDDPPRFDNAFPEVAVDGLGQVHVAWYDRRDDPQCGLEANTYWTWSEDGGQSFAPSRRLSSQSSHWRPIEAGVSIGDHLGLVAEGDRVHALWTQFDRPDLDIYGVRIEAGVTGIAVSGFEAKGLEDFVRLSWTVSDGRDLLGFRLYRAEGASASFCPLGSLLPSHGEGPYVTEDRAVQPGKTYRYRLEVMGPGGESQWAGPVEITVPRLPSRLTWGQPSPNPFAESLALTLRMPRAGDAWVRVYDVAGHEIRTLHRGALPAGEAQFLWDGRDRGGAQAAAGVYLVRVDLGDQSATLRVIRMR